MMDGGVLSGEEIQRMNAISNELHISFHMGLHGGVVISTLTSQCFQDGFFLYGVFMFSFCMSGANTSKKKKD